MIAFIPDEASLGKLYVDGGDEEKQLHLTFVYLGEVADFVEEEKEELLRTINSMLPAEFDGKAFAHASFNPDDEEREQCATYIISELPKSLEELRGKLSGYSKADKEFFPWIPHITAGFNLDPRDLDYTGAITFDRLRVCFGKEQTDFELTQAEEK